MSSDEELTDGTDGAQDVQAEELTDELARKYDPDRLLNVVARRAGRGESLEHSVRAKYEKRFGVDLGHVRVYTGEFAEEFNRQRNAYAVTIGSTGMIMMGGSPDKSMASASGKALLAHELTHVAQAQKGMHRKATFDGGMPFTEEHEAEAGREEEASMNEELYGADASNRAAADAASATVAYMEAFTRALDEIQTRVFDMAADAARNQLFRNGPQRRA